MRLFTKTLCQYISLGIDLSHQIWKKHLSTKICVVVLTEIHWNPKLLEYKSIFEVLLICWFYKSKGGTFQGLTAISVNWLPEWHNLATTAQMLSIGYFSCMRQTVLILLMKQLVRSFQPIFADWQCTPGHRASRSAGRMQRFAPNGIFLSWNVNRHGTGLVDPTPATLSRQRPLLFYK